MGRRGREGGKEGREGEAEHIAIIWTYRGRASERARAGLSVTRGCASFEAGKFTLIYRGSQKGGGAKGWMDCAMSALTTAAGRGPAGHLNVHLRQLTDLDSRLIHSPTARAHMRARDDSKR